MAELPQTSSTVIVQRLLDLLKSGDADASRQLLDVTMERLRILSAKILADIPGVARWKRSMTWCKTVRCDYGERSKNIIRQHRSTTFDWPRLRFDAS